MGGGFSVRVTPVAVSTLSGIVRLGGRHGGSADGRRYRLSGNRVNFIGCTGGERGGSAIIFAKLPGGEFSCCSSGSSRTSGAVSLTCTVAVRGDRKDSFSAILIILPGDKHVLSHRLVCATLAQTEGGLVLLVRSGVS